MARVMIKRVGVLSLAKIQAVVMAAIGVFVGVIYALMMLTFGAVMMSQAGNSGIGAMAGGVAGGLLMIVIIPVFYAVLGFITGAISAFIYNLAAGVIGGLELELSDMNAPAGFAAAPPPPPGQWTPNV